FNPLAQPLEASQKLGGRELVWRFDGGAITSDGGVLALKQSEAPTGIVRRFAACFTAYRTADQTSSEGRPAGPARRPPGPRRTRRTAGSRSAPGGRAPGSAAAAAGTRGCGGSRGARGRTRRC